MDGTAMEVDSIATGGGSAPDSPLSTAHSEPMDGQSRLPEPGCLDGTTARLSDLVHCAVASADGEITMETCERNSVACNAETSPTESISIDTATAVADDAVLRPSAPTNTASVDSTGCAGERQCEREVVREGAEMVVDGGVEMEGEAKRERESRESSISSGGDREEAQRLANMQEHLRYNRLQHLLQKSSIYSTFLLKKMENQVAEQQETVKKRGRRKKIVATDAADGSSSKKRGDSAGVNETGKMPQSAVKGRKTNGRRGRKRKAEEGSMQLSQFMNSEGQLKKRKLANGKAATPPDATPPDATPSSDSGACRKTVEEEVEEERYFKGQLISVRQPRLLTGGVMRSYQLDGMEWIKVLYENGVNGILADEMGLGKTIQCIAVIAYLIEMGVKGPFLVAAPLSTVPNWVAEFKKFTPSIPVVLYHGSIQEREDLRRKIFASTLVKKGSKSRDELQPVVVTSYEICMRDQRFLYNRKWKFLVVDEGHRIKNLNCKLIKALKSYDAANRLLLTGTPLQNNLAELWSLLNFLLPDIFDDLNSFHSWFDFGVQGEDEMRERIIAQEREQNVLSKLHQILTPFLLRRLKTDVEFNLPPKKEVLVYAPLTATQQRYYQSLLDNTILQMIKEKREKAVENGVEEDADSGTAEGGMPPSAEGDEEARETRRSARKREERVGFKYAQVTDDQFESILKGEVDLNDVAPDKEESKQKPVANSVTNIKLTNVFMMLRKCCNHPYLLEFPMTPEGEFRVDEEIVTSCGKIMLLDRMIPALINAGHKMLVFSQFTMMLDILEDYLDLRKLTYSRLDGAMPFVERERQMTVFREDPDCHIFLLSTRAGGLGINLTHADTVFIFDSDWNPQSDLQAQDRCHRIGQSKPVMVYRLVTANTIDQRVVERATSKRRLEKMIIHKGKFKGYGEDEEQFSLDDLTSLLHSVDHHQVVQSGDSVISDSALAALLDRSFTSGKKHLPVENTDGTEKEVTHTEVFKVVEERSTVSHVLSPSSKECAVPVNVGSAVVVLDDQSIACRELKGNGDCVEGESVQACIAKSDEILVSERASCTESGAATAEDKTVASTGSHCVLDDGNSPNQGENIENGDSRIEEIEASVGNSNSPLDACCDSTDCDETEISDCFVGRAERNTALAIKHSLNGYDAVALQPIVSGVEAAAQQVVTDAESSHNTVGGLEPGAARGVGAVVGPGRAPDTSCGHSGLLGHVEGVTVKSLCEEVVPVISAATGTSKKNLPSAVVQEPSHLHPSSPSADTELAFSCVSAVNAASLDGLIDSGCTMCALDSQTDVGLKLVHEG